MNPSFTPKQYGDVAAIYDALMHNVPHRFWLTRIERAVAKRGKSPKSVLDVACGTGIATELLDFRGYKPVLGVDISPQMIRIAQTKAQAHNWNIEYLVQDAAELDLPGRAFDMAISLFDSFNYILQPERLQRAFERIHLHIVPGGVFAFDLNAIYAFEEELFTQSGDYHGIVHDWTSEYDPATRLCRVEMTFAVTDEESGTVRHFDEVHLQRGYEVNEIKTMLATAGFVAIDTFGNYGERAPTAKSDRLLFVAERPI